MYPIDTETIHTAVGDYVINWYHDENADQPYDEGFTLITNGERDRINIETGDAVSALGRNIIQALSNSYHQWDHVSGAAIVRYLRLAGRLGVTLVDSDYTPTTASTDRDERVYGVAWAPEDAAASTVSLPDGSTTDHAEYTRLALAQWHAWANGETFGWQLIDPSGNEVDSCWGYFNTKGEKEYTLQHATEIAQADALDRLNSANLAGAGFVGLV